MSACIYIEGRLKVGVSTTCPMARDRKTREL